MKSLSTLCLALACAATPFVATYASAQTMNLSSRSQSDCAQSNFIWTGGTCLEVSADMRRTWFHVGTDLSKIRYELPTIRAADFRLPTFAPNYSPTSFRLKMEITGGFAAFVPVNASQGSASVLLWEGGKPPNQAGEQKFYMLGGGDPIEAHYIPATAAGASQRLKALRDNGKFEANVPYLVIDLEDVAGTLFFTDHQTSAAPSISHDKRAPNDPCRLFVGGAKNQLQPCVAAAMADPRQAYMRYDDEEMAMVVLKRRFVHYSSKTDLVNCMFEDCDLATHLLKAYSDIKTAAPFLAGQNLDTWVARATRVMGNLRRYERSMADQIAFDTRNVRNEIEDILDAMSFDGTETLAAPVTAQDNSRSYGLVANLLGEIGSIGIGQIPVVGDAIGHLQTGESLFGAISAFWAEQPEAAGLSRSPTVAVAKKYFRQLAEDAAATRYSHLSWMMGVLYRDFELAELYLEGHVNDVFNMSAEQLADIKREMWRTTLGSLGFVVATNPKYEDGNAWTAVACPVSVNYEMPSTVARTTHLALKEAAWGDETGANNGRWKVEQSRHVKNRLYETNIKEVYEWQLRVGSPVESRPLAKEAFDDLLTLMPRKDIYDIVNPRSYFETWWQAAERRQGLPYEKDNDCTQPKCWGIRLFPSDTPGIFQRTADMSDTDADLIYLGVFHGAPLNPMKGEKTFFAIGPEVAQNRCN